MQRCQFYPSEVLLSKIREDAEKKGISQAAAIEEKLELAYGLIDDEADEPEAFSEIMTVIKAEVENYVKSVISNLQSEEIFFTLYKASKKFAEISMSDSTGRLVAMKPRIGKAFRSMVDKKLIENVVPYYKDGKQKREHNAAVYQIKKEGENLDAE